MIVWKDFPDGTAVDLTKLAAARRLFPVVSFPGTRLPLPGTSLEDYLAALRTPKRHRLRRNLRRGKEACPLAASVATNPSREELEEIFALFWQTYERGKTKFERLTPEFFFAIAAEPPAHFVLLRSPATGRLAAFMLLFLSGRRAINKFIGIDYQLGREGKLYFQLWEHAVRWAYTAGAAEIQSGQTGYPVKFDIGHELVPLTNYCKHRSRLAHRVFAAVSSRVTWASLDPDLP
jgi:predicted N-acyltransferase